MVTNEGNEGAPIGIIFDSFDFGGDVWPSGALEIDDSVHALVAAALVAHGDATGCTGASGATREADGETRMGTSFVELGLVGEGGVAIGWGGGFSLNYSGTC